MLIYAVILVVIFNLYLLSTVLKTNKSTNSVISLIIMCLIGAVVGLRGTSVGADTASYYNEFLNANYYWNNLLRLSERSYSYLNYFLSSKGFSFQFFLLSISFFVVFVYSFVFSKYSKSVVLSFYLYVTLGTFAFSLSGIRQTIAISLTLIASYFLLKKKYMFFFLLVLFAYTFHNSAIIFLLAFPLSFVRLNRKRAVGIVCLTPLVLLIVPFISTLVNTVAPQKYIGYLKESMGNVNILLIFFYFILSALLAFMWPRYQEKYEVRENSYFFLLCNMCVIIFIFAREIRLFERMVYYFLPYLCITFPNFLSKVSNKKIKLILNIGLFVCSFIYFFIAYHDNSLMISDYRFFFQQIVF